MKNAEEELSLDIDDFIPTLLKRPMGTALFRVSQFNEWIQSSGIDCPVKLPNVKYYPVELFLFRISINLQPTLSPQRVIDIVESNVEMSAQVERLRQYKNLRNETTPINTMAVGAHASRAWSRHIVEAIESGKLVLFDFISKLPIRIQNDLAAQNQSDLTDSVDCNNSKTKARTLSIRERLALLRLIAGLVELLLDKRPTRAETGSATEIIDALVKAYGDKDGISKRTLESKFAEAKQILESD